MFKSLYILTSFLTITPVINFVYPTLSPQMLDLGQSAGQIVECHINIIYDTNNIRFSQSTTNPVTIRKIVPTLDEDESPTVSSRKIQLDVIKTKYIFCIYNLVQFENPELVFHQSTKPNGNGTVYNNTNYWYPIEHAISESTTFFKYTHGRSSNVQEIQPRVNFMLYIIENPISNSSMLAFLKHYFRYSNAPIPFALRVHNTDSALAADVEIYRPIEGSSNVLLNLFPEGNDTTNKSFYFSLYGYKENQDPVFIPMEEKYQENIIEFLNFIGEHRLRIFFMDVSAALSTEHLDPTTGIPSLPFNQENPFRINPMDLIDDTGFYLFVLRDILLRSNSSLRSAAMTYERLYYDNKGEVVYGASVTYPSMFIDVDFAEEGQVEHQGTFNKVFESLVLTEVEGFNYLTCYTSSYLSFSTYLEPFQKDLWIAILTSAIILWVMFHPYLRFQSSQSQGKIQLNSFSPLILMIASMVEQSLVVPSKIEKLFQFRLVIGLWLLIVLIFTNAYKGLAITGVTSPLPLKSVESFENLTSYFYKCSPYVMNCTEEVNYGGIKIYANDNPNPMSPDAFKIFSTGVDQYWKKEGNKSALGEYAFKFGRLLNTFYHRLVKHFHPEYFSMEKSLLLDNPVFTRDDFVMLSFTNPSHVVSPTLIRFPSKDNANISLDSAIEEDITKCGRRAFVDLRKRVLAEYRYLSTHYHSMHFTLGEENLALRKSSWLFEYSGGSRVPEYLKYFLQSGIYDKLKEHFNIVLFTKRLNFTRGRALPQFEPVKPIKISDTIQTIFFIYGLVIAISVCLFILEAKWAVLRWWYDVKFKPHLSTPDILFVSVTQYLP